MGLQRRSVTTSHEGEDLVAVRELLQGYHGVLLRSEQSVELSQWAPRRWLRERLASARMRNHLGRLSRSLHSRLAREPAASDDVNLDAIEHFQASLLPPTSTLARTGFAVSVLLLTQLLSLIPLVPVQAGSAKIPTLGTLSEALDLTPAHLTSAVNTLLHSSAPTMLTLLSTLSLALFLAFAPALPDLRKVQRLFDDGHRQAPRTSSDAPHVASIAGPSVVETWTWRSGRRSQPA